MKKPKKHPLTKKIPIGTIADNGKILQAFRIQEDKDLLLLTKKMQKKKKDK